MLLSFACAISLHFQDAPSIMQKRLKQPLIVSEVPLKEAISKLSDSTGVPIRFRGSSGQNVKVTYSSGVLEVPFQVVLERLLYRVPDLWYGVEADSVVVYLDTTVNPEFLNEIKKAKSIYATQMRTAYIKIADTFDMSQAIRDRAKATFLAEKIQATQSKTDYELWREKNLPSTPYDTSWQIVEKFLNAHGKNFDVVTMPNQAELKPLGGLRWLPDGKQGFHRSLRQFLIRLNPPMTWDIAQNKYRIRPLNNDEFMSLKSNFDDVANLDVMVAGETGEERAKVLSPDGKSLFVLSSTRLSRFSADGKKELATVSLLQGHHLSVSPNSEFLAVGRNQHLQVFRARDLSPQGTVETRSAGAPRPTFSEDGKMIACWDGTTILAGPVASLGSRKLPYDYRGDRTRELGQVTRLEFLDAPRYDLYIETGRQAQVRSLVDFSPMGEIQNPGGLFATLGPKGTESVSLEENRFLFWRRKVRTDVDGKRVFQEKEMKPFPMQISAFIQKPVVSEDLLIASFQKTVGKKVTVNRLQWKWGEEKPALETKEFQSSNNAGIAAFAKFDLTNVKPTIPNIDRKPVPGNFVLGSDPDLVFLDLPGELGIFNLRTGASVNPATLIAFPGAIVQRRKIDMIASNQSEIGIQVEEAVGNAWVNKNYRVSLTTLEATPGSITEIRNPMEITATRDAVTVKINGKIVNSLDPKKYYKFDEQTSDQPEAIATADGQTIYVNYRGQTLELTKDGEQEFPNWIKVPGRSLQLSSSGRYLQLFEIDGRGASDRVNILDLWTRKTTYSGPGQIVLFAQRYSNKSVTEGEDIDWMYIPSDGTLRVISPTTEELTIAPTNDRVRKIQMNSRRSHLVGLTDSGQLVIWHAHSGRWLASHIALNGGKYVTYTPDRFYMASRGAANLLYFRRGTLLYPFDQFDMRLNRPDIVMNRLMTEDTETQELYWRAYLSRVRRSYPDIIKDWEGLPKPTSAEGPAPDPNPFEKINLFSLAQIDILSELPKQTERTEVEVSFRITDEQAKLVNYNCYVNGVPLLGSDGVDIRGKNTKLLEEKVRVHLNPGVNRIKIVATNESAGETRSDPIEINCTSQAQPTLYLVLFGANQYQDPSRLKSLSADKDVEAIKAAFVSQKGKEFKDVKVFEKTGQSVTLKSVEEALTFVKSAQPEDRVIVFYGGHGLLVKTKGEGEQQEPKYLLAAYATNLDTPDLAYSSSIPFDYFQTIVDQAPAREKLLLLDSCHSGELDPETTHEFRSNGQTPQAATSSVIARSTPEYIAGQQTSRAFVVVREQFIDLRRRSGAVVIAASMGDQQAWDTGKNGMFTAVFLEGINGAADGYAGGQKDGKVQISEVLPFVSDTVQWRTNNAQRPLARQENFENDFILFGGKIGK